MVERVEGLDDFIDKLSRLPRNVQRNVVTGGIRAGARVIANDAKQRAKRLDDPTTPTDISKNIAVRLNSRLGRRNNGVAVQVGVRGGAKAPSKTASAAFSGKGNPGGDTYYWRFLEFGTAKMPARPFMRPAMNGTADAALSAATEYMSRRLMAEIDKL